MNIGKFITFEGGEGVGKSTQVHLLAEYMKSVGVDVYTTREPGGNEQIDKIRTLLKNSDYHWDSMAETLLMFAARAEHLKKVIFPLIESGVHVICDRFYDSTIVYQGLLKGIDIAKIMEIKQMIMGDFEPNITIILDAAPEITTKRIAMRLGKKDVYDAMAFDKHVLVRQGFLKISEIFDFRARVINASGGINNIQNRIKNAVAEIL